MPQIINLSPIGEVLPGDSLPIFDESNGDARRMSVAQMQTYMQNNLNMPDNSDEVSFLQAGTGAVATTVQTKLRESVSVKDFGAGSEIGALLQAAIDSGATYIEIPDATNWIWTTPVVLPELWRGRIVSHQSKDVGHAIIAKTGHNNPCIDAQGAYFVELEGFNVAARDSTNSAPACFIVYARMPSGASSSNHRLLNSLIEGQWYYCGIYNCGGEELYFENNYVSIYNTNNSITHQTAAIVHTLNEESYFSGIVTKASRANAVSTSAIKHIGDNIQNRNVGGSAIYIGPNTNDITFDLLYGFTVGNAYYLTLGGYFDGIRFKSERIETLKTSPIIYVPNTFTAGSIDIVGGAYRRGGSVDPTKYAIDIAGPNTSTVVLTVSPDVKWTPTFGGEVEDIYLLRCTRKMQCNVSFIYGAQAELLNQTMVTIDSLLGSVIQMGRSSNLTVSNYFQGNQLFFFYDQVISANNAAFVFTNGMSVRDGLRFPNLSSDPAALDYYQEGSFTLTSSDLSGSPSVTARYTRIGNTVTVSIPTLTGTSNSPLFACTGLPAAITPATGKSMDATLINSGTALSGRVLFNVDSILYCFNNLTDTNNLWTSSGTKAIPANSFTYTLV